jgi:hypothetical protein
MFALATYSTYNGIHNVIGIFYFAIFAPNHVKHFALFDFCSYDVLLQKTHGIYQDIPA